jgi:hypothetical protein
VLTVQFTGRFASTDMPQITTSGRFRWRRWWKGRQRVQQLTLGGSMGGTVTPTFNGTSHDPLTIKAGRKDPEGAVNNGAASTGTLAPSYDGVPVTTPLDIINGCTGC